MSGSFSNEIQAFRDTNYSHVNLMIKPIWFHRTDGYWFYVEQALAGNMAKPYRQRVYHLYQLNDTYIENRIYTIKEPARFVGEYAKALPLENLSPDSLEKKAGCDVRFVKTSKDHFTGNTDGRNCISSMKGATYTSSEVSIIPDLIISWDRGFDQNNKQVWGPESGGYLFAKMKNWTPVKKN